jgi:hypothetical protein
MAGKYKTTGCFKFLLFLLIFVPIAYFGAAYYHGIDGVDQIKDIIGIESNEVSDQSTIETNTEDTFDLKSKEQIERLENRIKELEAELYRKTQEIEKLQAIRDN